MDGIADQDWLLALQPGAGPWLASELAAPPVPLPSLAAPAGGALALATPPGATLSGTIPSPGTVAAASRYVLVPRTKVVSVADQFTYFILRILPPSSGAAGVFQAFDLAGTGVTVDSFAVNGVPRGNSVVGAAFATDPHQGRFVAPSAEPSPSTVSVTAVVTDGARTIPVAAKVRISGDEGYLVFDGLSTYATRWTNSLGLNGPTIPGYVRNRLSVQDYLVRLGAPEYAGGGTGAAYLMDPEITDYKVTVDYATKAYASGVCDLYDFTYSSRAASVVLVDPWLSVVQNPGFDPQPDMDFTLEFDFTGGATLHDYTYHQPGQAATDCSGARVDSPDVLSQPQYTWTFAPATFVISRSVGDKFLVGQRWFQDRIGPQSDGVSEARDFNVRFRARWKIPYVPR
jgi:hypothetical protein